MRLGVLVPLQDAAAVLRPWELGLVPLLCARLGAAGRRCCARLGAAGASLPCCCRVPLQRAAGAAGRICLLSGVYAGLA